MGPLEAVKPWQSNQLMGVVRFRDKVFSLAASAASLSNKRPEGALLRDTHRIIKKVTGDIERLAFNTVISNLMIYCNTLTSELKGKNSDSSTTALPKQTVETLVLLLSPIAPHVAEECWSLLGHSKSLAYHPWPTYDEELCADATKPLTIQVNGKVRATIEVGAGITEEEAIAAALELPKIAKFTDSATIKKTIYVAGKVLNIVI